MLNTTTNIWYKIGCSFALSSQIRELYIYRRLKISSVMSPRADLSLRVLQLNMNLVCLLRYLVYVSKVCYSPILSKQKI